MCNEAVPVFAGGSVEQHARPVVPLRDPSQRNLQHQAGPAGVGDDKVAAAAQHEQRPSTRLRFRDGRAHVLLAAGFDEIPRRAADLEGGQRRQRDLLLDLHAAQNSREGQGFGSWAMKAFTAIWLG